ncbi:hypothetical protein IEZ77_002068 [Listeria monocytogenes]|nr:hypothetical protein [Listeria monocytogenes]
MNKLAITYYYSMMSGRVQNIEIHSSGKKAVAYLEKTAPQYFELPPVKKSELRLKGEGSCRIGFPFRYMLARFLSEEERAAYTKYGDKVWIDHEKQELIAPPKEENEWN